MNDPTNPGADHAAAAKTAKIMSSYIIKENANLARAYLEKIAEDEKCFSYEAMADMAKQRDEARAQLAAAREALEKMLNHYTSLANSGDAGFWDPETEPEVIQARAALKDTPDGEEAR